MSEFLNLPPGFKLIVLDTVDSTNDELKRRAVSGFADEGLAIWSRIQTSGKGRNKRRWVSDIGNMYISVLFRPKCSLPDAAQLGFLPVIAASKTLDYILGQSPDISYKWPNDLLLNKKKIGGTLLEAGFNQKNNTVWVVVGFGLNLQHFPFTTFSPATSIKNEIGVELKIEEVVALYLQNLSELYSNWQEMGFQPVRNEWLNRGHVINESLRVKLGAENLLGFFRDLDETGALVIETGNGPRRVSAGDVYLLPTMGEF
jgi:BirA family biotin operon repressor/biotin-[acetyl-CoA-carboxylase] ligase